MKIRKINRAFSLVEIMLVLVIVSMMSVLKMSEVKTEQQNRQAKALGEQVKNIAKATNSYINLNYDEIVKLKSDPSNSDHSPIQCNAASFSCKITIATLINAHLLNKGISAKSVLGNDFEIEIVRTGESPNYMLKGIVLSSGVSNKTKEADWIMLGKALEQIGIDGGLMKKQGEFSGYYGNYKLSPTEYPSLKNKKELIGSVVGYSANLYSLYLRRDGTLPMSGNLNMDLHNIDHVNTLNALTVNTDDLKSKKISSDEIVANNSLTSKLKTDLLGRTTIGGDYLNINAANINIENNVVMKKELNLLGNLTVGGANNTIKNTLNTQTIKNTGNVNIDGLLSVGGNIAGNKDILASGNIKGNEISGNNASITGVTKTARVLLTGKASAGSACSSAGELLLNQDNAVLVCKKGIWRNIIVQNIPPQEIHCRSQLDASLYSDHYARIDANGVITSRTTRTGYGDSGWKEGSSSVKYGITNIINTGISGRTLTYRSEQGEYICMANWKRD